MPDLPERDKHDREVAIDVLRLPSCVMPYVRGGTLPTRLGRESRPHP
jgi:hypothetical protein